MASNIGPKIGIEGEDSFRNSLKDIGNDLRTLASESKAVAAEMQNQDDATKGLTAQNEILKKTADDLTEQLKIQEQAYAAAKDQLGENDAVTQKWEQALNNTRAQLANTEAEINKNNEAMAQMRKEKFDEVVKKIGDGFKAVGAAAAAAGAAIGATVTATIKTASETAKAGDEIDKMSQKMGLSAQAYQEWDYVLNLAGTEMSSMTTGLKTLTNKIDDAKNGSATAQAMFAKLGISMEELATMSREDVFEATIYGFQGMEDSAERAALANDLYGKSGQNLTPLFNQTAEQTREQIALANEYGMVMSDELVKDSAAFVDAQTTLSNTLGGLKNKLVGEFLPAFTSVSEGLAAIFGGDTNTGLAKVREGLENFMAQLVAALPRVLELGGAILGGLLDGIVDMLPEISATATNVIMTLTAGLLDALPTIFESAATLIMTLVNGIADALPQLIPAALDAVITITDSLIAHAGELLQAALKIIEALARGLIQYLPQLVRRLPEIITGIINFFTSNIALVIELGITLMVELAKGMVQAIPEIVRQLPTIIKAIVDGMLTGVSQMATVGLDLIKGLWNGIKNAKDWLFNMIKGFCKGVVDKVKNLFGIHSPSTVFAGIGENLAKGLGVGFEDEMIDVRKDIAGAIPTPTLSSVVSGAVNGMAAMQIGGNGPFTINLVVPDGRLLAQYMFDPLADYAKANGTPIVNPA